jgi:hypothetical protein
MREIRPSGSVRGVRRKPYPYRDTNSSGAQHRAYRVTNDCVTVDRQERLNGVLAMQSDDAL